MHYIENWYMLTNSYIKSDMSVYKCIIYVNCEKSLIQTEAYPQLQKLQYFWFNQLCMARTGWSDSVIRSASVLFSRCTTLVVKKCWPMETRLRCGDQWKAEKLGAFWHWPILFSRCTTLVVKKCWPMETRLRCGDQWKAEKLGAFWHWPITKCLIKSYRAGLIIEHSVNFPLNGEHLWAVQFQPKYTVYFYFFHLSCEL